MDIICGDKIRGIVNFLIFGTSLTERCPSFANAKLQRFFITPKLFEHFFEKNLPKNSLLSEFQLFTHIKQSQFF